MSPKNLIRSLAFLILAWPVAVPMAIFAQSPSHVRKYKAPQPAARVEIMVVRDTTGKPVMNAAVIAHPIEGDRDKGNMELKSNEDGIAVLDQVIPIGSTIRLQVIAPGYQTYGEDYKIESAEKQIIVRLKRPSQQYSIYAKTPGTTTPTDTKTPEPKNSNDTPKPVTPPVNPNSPATENKQPQPKN